MSLRLSNRVRYLPLVVCLAATACSRAALVEGTAPAGGPAHRALQVEMRERFYAVSGQSASALNLALLQAGPRSGGRVAHALTEWRVRWSYVPLRRSSSCACGSPSVELEIVTTLPRWRELGQAPDALVEDWTLYMSRLRAHETGHQSLVLTHGSELLVALAELEATDCDVLREEAERAAALLWWRFEKGHRSYDLASDYGTSFAGSDR